MARLPAIALLILSLFLPAGAFAENRLALVITNKDYPASIGALSNTHSDGERIARTLTRLGFSVVHKRDLTKDQMLAEFSAYAARLTGAGPDAVGFFYYSGHGAANSAYGENYLIPVAAPLTLDSQLVLFGVKAGDVIDALSATPAKANFVVLDSCRDVPLEFALRGERRGLRSVKERRGMLVAFATDPGKTATDSGVYAEALAAELERPGEEASHVFRAVRRRVLEATAGKQFPWHADGLLDDFYFVPQQVAAAKPVEIPKPEKPEDRAIAASSPAELPAAIKPVEPARPAPAIRYEDATQRLVRTFTGHTQWVLSVALSPDNRFALSGSLDSTLRLWEVATGKELRSFGRPTGGGVPSVAFSPDGRFALSAGDTMNLWEVTTGNQLRGFLGGASAVTFSPDGRFALSGSSDHTLELREVATGKKLRSFTGHTYGVFSVAFSPDGRFALSGGGGYLPHGDYAEMKLWEVATGKELRSFGGHSHPVFTVVWSPDGHFILSGAFGTLKLWEPATGKELRSFNGGERPAAFSPDSRLVLSGSGDALKLWELATGKELRSFAGHTDMIRSIAFSSDGRFALSGSDDKTLKLWDVSEWTQAPGVSAAK
ncbi:MAG: caspase family protein [Rhodomicrobium sp.]